MPDKSSRNVYLMYLPLLVDFEDAGRLSWGSAVLAYLYRELCRGTKYDRKEIGGCQILLHLWAWDRFPMLAPSRPPMPDLHADIFQLSPPLGYRYHMINVYMNIFFQASLFYTKMHDIVILFCLPRWAGVKDRFNPPDGSLRHFRLMLDRMHEDEV